MNVEEFLKTLTQIMDTEADLTLDTQLKDLEEWDSLSLVSFLSFCNSKLKLSVTPEEVKAAATVGELFKIAGGK